MKPVGEVIETEYGSFLELSLPNKEVRRVYNSEILFWLRSALGEMLWLIRTGTLGGVVPGTENEI